jgi:hypothetical protein
VTLILPNHRIDRVQTNFSIAIQPLLDRYFQPTYLTDRLQELPVQFEHPQPRKWAQIDWRSINPNLIAGIETSLFLAILKGAIDTEAPIRDYTQTSRQYLAAIHPQMATFVGGSIDADGNTNSKGIWELEECRHAPALMVIYHRLSGERIAPNPKLARTYQPTNAPDRDLYRHGLSRIFTEYGAVCLYLWLIGHSTGTLQQVLIEMLQDEINHLIKFWGFGVWLYPSAPGRRFLHGCSYLLPRRSANGNLFKTYQRMLSVLHYQQWTYQQQWQIISTFYLVMQRLLAWHHRLTSADLDRIFGRSPNR